ncbi:fimbrial protein [Stenotrophomonas maltophilia]|uniref:fimbrial protein n=1 Tax=Stenotrophomonas maltophilia TaxID=40324 RepID=UPI0009A1842C|nr:fimbrial protein [Stenotrophomonas maltophilia]
MKVSYFSQESFAPARKSHTCLSGRVRMLWGAMALALFAPAIAQACTAVEPGQQINLVVNAWDDAEPDLLVADFRSGGSVRFLMNCPSGDIPIDVSPSITGLEFVRNVTVSGESYPAFGLLGQPQSPLLIFKSSVEGSSGGGPSRAQPFDIRTPLHVSGLNISGVSRWSIVYVAAVSRGGEMRAVPETSLGTITHAAPRYPHLVKSDAYRISANIRSRTCTLDDTSVELKDVQAADLPGAGSTAGQLGFNVVMRCNGAFPAELTLTDANAAGNTSSRLTPTRNATAGAVQVELLRDGNPVVLGQTWSLPATQNGPQNIGLAARYYRAAGTFSSGVVEGQATLTVSYR